MTFCPLQTRPRRRINAIRYLAGDHYTIADMALWGWALSAGYIFGERGLSNCPNVQRLIEEICGRPAALSALAIRDRTQVKTALDNESRKALFPLLHQSKI